MIEEDWCGRKIKIEFLYGHPLKIYPIGKSWPKTTQCVIYDNGRIIGLGEVVKHEKDIDNSKYARIYSAKKAFKQVKLLKEIKKILWKRILEL